MTEVLDFALSLIRAPWATRLRDRTFQTLIFTAVTSIGGAIAVWRTEGIPVNDKVNMTFAALGAIAAVGSAFTLGDKAKDARIGTAAIHALETIESRKPAQSVGGAVADYAGDKATDYTDKKVDQAKDYLSRKLGGQTVVVAQDDPPPAQEDL